MNALDLFPGIGCTMLAGLIHGIQPIGAVEWDAYRCAVLRERAAEGWFPHLEVHEQDVRTFDATPYAGRVDLLRAGWPCQGISRIGKRRGLADERSGLWSEVVRVLGVVRPERAFLENGPDIVDLCLDVVLADLTRLGYDARYGIVAAANAGAAHGRPRWFCVANRVRDGLEGVCGGGSAGGNSQKRSRWPTPIRQDSVGSRRLGYDRGTMSIGTTLTDACRIHHGVATGRAGKKRSRMVLPNPEFSGWLMRLPGGWSKLKSRRLATGKTSSRRRSHGGC